MIGSIFGWILAAANEHRGIVIGLVFAAAVTCLVASSPSDHRGRAGGIALAFGLAFSTALDPPKREATEEIEKKRQMGLQDEQSDLDIDA